MEQPFEIPFADVEANIETYIDSVFASLRSEFLALPKAVGFVEYPIFEEGYEALKRQTGNFRTLEPDAIVTLVRATPIAFIVLRTMLGFTPPEWAYVTTEHANVEVPQGAARTLDRNIRLHPMRPLRAAGGVTEQRIRAMIATACRLLADGAPDTPGLLHRLDKADTRHGLRSVQPLADLGVPYAMVLYERFLGRPFAGHRDSVSELVGDVVEAAVEAVLAEGKISYRKTRRAERVEGFDQAPDFIVPSEFNPKVVIEAKLTEDDGTARDKVTRVQHLGALSMKGKLSQEEPHFEVIACIAGRGFKVRREDMKKLLIATRGKVFTLETITQMVGHRAQGFCGEGYKTCNGMAQMITIEKIDASLIGIGSIIKSSRFLIPIYQRPYSWTDAQIEDLYRDVADAIAPPVQDYFLGTIVTTRNEDNRLTIIDGQQRLVTVSVLIASIRDYFLLDGQTERAQDIEREYLFKRDIRTQELTPHILLTAEDRDFFVQTVAMAPPLPPAVRSAVPASPAQQRLHRAVEIAANFIKSLATTTQKGDDRLLDLIDFLTEKAKLVSVSVGSESSAFIIFEVLNDRGLDLSITDLLKNFIFRTAGDRAEEAQVAWAQMTAIITEVASEPELKNFIRHNWVATHGMTRERELYDAIKKGVKSKAAAVEFAKSLAKAAPVCAGLGNPSSELWDDYDAAVKQSIEVLDQLGVTQLRPLLLAIFKQFKPDQTAKALPMIVAWTVRFLICGSGGSGTLESAYADRAAGVSSGKVSTAQALWEPMKAIVPDDVTFKDKFAKATVSNANLAKYYLRVLEQQSKLADDEMIVNPDQGKVNLEHILPRNPQKGWAHIPADQYPALVKRLGNLTLLATRLNSKVANADFAEKKKYFEVSAIKITKELCDFSEWTAKEIEGRQDKLADLAVKAWPSKPR